MTALTTIPRRSLWGWRGPNDWSSHLDPLYHRFHRVRTLKTRAKLLNKLRRRGKFEWDGNAANFFTPKHVRWASRWDGSSWKPREWKDDETPARQESGREGEAVGAGGGYELSEREKVWRQQMHAMRKRIESDPYEALFGKRFEPFWSPLVPSWMREEMGLPVWQSKDFSKQTDAKGSPPTSNETLNEPKKDSNERVEHVSDVLKKDLMMAEKQQWEVAGRMAKPDNSKANAEAKVPESNVDVAVPKKPMAFSYASSTSWDSWTNKTKRVEWDSVSGASRKYEYDPISNRMVQVAAHYPGQMNVTEQEKLQSGVTQPESHPKVTGSSSTSTSDTPSIKQDDTGAVNIPIKQSSEGRKSIPIPPPLSQPSYNVPMGFSPKQSSLGPVKSTAVASGVPKPAALTAFPEKATLKEIWKVDEDLASLTAEDIRAGIPKLKSIPKSTLPPPATNPQQQGEQDFNSLDAQPHIDALFKKSEAAFLRVKQSSERHEAEIRDMLLQQELDSLHKKKEKLLRDEKGLFHIERQKREVMKLDQRIRQVADRVAKLVTPTLPSTNERVSAIVAAKTMSGSLEPTTTPDAQRVVGKIAPAYLQPSLDRMQSKTSAMPKTIEEIIDADDAAAHESTEPLPVTAAANVPEQWNQQADLLQADRVQRTAAKTSYPDMCTLITDSTEKTRLKQSVDNSLQRLVDFSSTPKYVSTERFSGSPKIDRSYHLGGEVLQPLSTDPKGFASGSEQPDKVLVDSKLTSDKLKTILDSEVRNAKSGMEAHEMRFARHYPGSGVPASAPIGLNLERMHESREEPDVPPEPSKVRESFVEREAVTKLRERYGAKIKALRSELETAYKQSTVHSEKHLERIKELETSLRNAERSSRISEIEKKLQDKYAAKMKAMRGELEIAYKQSTVHSEKHLERINELQSQLQEARKTHSSGTATVPELTQAEGDVGQNVAKFAGSEKWYKQPATTPQSIKREMERAERKRKDRELVKEVRKIYEDAYGVIGTEQEQGRKQTESQIAELMKKKRGVVEVESDVDLGEALAKYESDLKLDNGVKAHLKTSAPRFAAALEREAHEGIKLVNQAAPTLDTASASFASTTTSAGSTIPWDQPPLYQILAYDSGNDRISTATTTSNFAGATEEPVSIPEALSRLYAPTKFVTNLAELQGKGWLVVHAGKDVLVFRKVGPKAKPEVVTDEAARKAAPPPSVSSTALATEHPSELNPFNAEEDYDIRHYPRVKREEYPVFTGTRRKWRAMYKEAERRNRRGKNFTRWAFGTGLAFAGVAYFVGRVEEMGRLEAEERRAKAKAKLTGSFREG